MCLAIHLSANSFCMSCFLALSLPWERVQTNVHIALMQVLREEGLVELAGEAEAALEDLKANAP
jgi:hypothetical protein